MYIKNIFIENFRNLDRLQLHFNENYTILYGKNAQGKTNIVESVYYLLNAKSHRETSFIHLINYEKEFAILKGTVLKDNLTNEIEIKLDKNNKKSIKVNGNATTTAELYEDYFAVIFSPDDLRIIKDGPDRRRRYIDSTLSKIDKGYKKALLEYDKLLRHRNTILRNYSKSSYSDMIDVFDKQLCFYGSYIIKKRLKHLNEIEKIVQTIHYVISEGSEKLAIHYQSSVIDTLEQTENISDIYHKKLKQAFAQDLKKATTSTGPHTDDISIFLNGRYAKKFASQGQQKTACIALKLSEIEIYKNYSNQVPIVILDDVFSELDKKRQQKLLQRVQGMQIIITSTNDNAKNFLDKKSYSLFEINNGKVFAIDE
jgi:DNA replication and repair protein RecF